jgi:hypothetical protein
VKLPSESESKTKDAYSLMSSWWTPEVTNQVLHW